MDWISLPWFSFLAVFLLVTAVSADAFAASFAYGMGGIRIPAASLAVITGISTAMLLLSLLLGGVLRPFLPPGLTRALASGILLLLGLAKLFDCSLKVFLRRHTTVRREWKVAGFELRFILNVYANPEEADSDHSRSLSPREAAPLAAALSLDGLAAGFGAGLAAVSFPVVALLSLGIGALSVLLGSSLGRKAAQKLPFDLSWLGGVLLLALAVMKLLSAGQG
ncbi:MAG TPA: manganese efflux pump [Firmicutes bacterium]|nr:manganese efflux pump [Bacillota bacterium]